MARAPLASSAQSIWEKPGTPSCWNERRGLFFLGQKDEALAVLRAYRPRAGSTVLAFLQLQDKIVQYDRDPGEGTKKDLLECGGRSMVLETFAHLAIGLRILAEGDRGQARRHFQQGVALHQFLFFEYSVIRGLLARMEKDPTWPPWIPLKR
jgi:hypothetical protein